MTRYLAEELNKISKTRSSFFPECTDRLLTLDREALQRTKDAKFRTAFKPEVLQKLELHTISCILLLNSWSPRSAPTEFQYMTERSTTLKANTVSEKEEENKEAEGKAIEVTEMRTTADRSAQQGHARPEDEKKRGRLLKKVGLVHSRRAPVVARERLREIEETDTGFFPISAEKSSLFHDRKSEKVMPMS